MSGGGGGGSSKVEHEGYLSSAQSVLLVGRDVSGTGTTVYGEEATSRSVVGALYRALSGEETSDNPYHTSNYTPVDPTTHMAAIASELAELDVLIDDLTDTTEIDAEVTAFEQAHEVTHFRSVNRLAGAFAANNAMNGTGFVLGMVQLESDFERQVAGFRSGLTLRNKELAIDKKLNSVQMHMQYQFADITADTDYQEAKADRKNRSLKWDLELFQYPSNVIASIGGGVVSDTSGHRNRAASALSGALSGASIGNQISPGIGTGIGAAVGGLAGLLS